MTALPLAGKTALVTGGGRGLGAALCDAMAISGARVVVADIDGHLAAAQAERLEQQGYAARSAEADIRNAVHAADCVNHAVEWGGGLDILINNAGVDYTMPFDELEVAQWDHVIATNLRGPFMLCRQAVRYMKPQGGGHIINIASTAAKRAWPNAAAYHASKWGLLGFSHALHAELRPHGIKVTAVIAGGMRTPFLLDRFPDIDRACLQEPGNVAAAVLAVILLPVGSVVPEISVLPMGETSWP